jgi:hypothetical protein
MAHVVIEFSGSESAHNAKASEYESIVHQLETDAPWVRYTTCDGAEMMTRAREISGVGYVSDGAAETISERERLDNLRGDP